MTHTCIVANENRPLVFNDDLTAHRSSRVKSEVYRAILFAQIKPNARKLIRQLFIVKTDTEPNNAAKTTQVFLKAKKHLTI